MRSRRSSQLVNWVLILSGAIILFAAGQIMRNRVTPSANAAENIVVSEKGLNSTTPDYMIVPGISDSAATTVNVEPVSEETIGTVGVQQQVAGGLTVEASDLRFEEDEAGSVTVLLDICFPMPTNNVNWTIYAATLSYSGFVVGDYGTTPIEILLVNPDRTAMVYEYANNQFTTFERPALESETSHRCDTVYFWGQPKEVVDSELNIAILALSADPTEGQTCTSDLVAQAQEAMDARAEGIILGCSDDGSGYAGITMIQIPDEISQDAADQIFFSNEFYLDTFGLVGPWVFSFPEKQ